MDRQETEFEILSVFFLNELNWKILQLNSPKLSGIPDGPGSKPGRPRNVLANEELRESIDPFSSSP